MKKKYFFSLFLLTLLVSATQTNAQLAVWNFTGDVLTSSSSDANVSPSDATQTGLTSATSFFTCNGDAWSPSSWNTTASVNISDDYAEYTITANTGFNLSVTGFTFSARRSSSGPANFSIRSSNDSYATDLLTGTISTSCNSKGGNFAAPITVTASNSLTIRIYGYNATSTGNMRMDDVTITGTSSSASSNPIVTFDSGTSTETETDSNFNTLIPVTFSNYAADVTLSVTIDGSSTAEAGDYTLNTSSLTFTGNGTQNVSLDINDDADYLGETVILNIAVTSGTSDISISQHTVTINDDDTPIVINEIHADPDSTNGDANGDGTASASQDEFIEIYNISGANLDISGWTLADGASDRHIFPNGTIIPANEAIVVFSGGTPVTVPGLVQVASSNALGLNNSGDTITIKNETSITILTEVYGSAGSNQSIARDVDFTGSFVNHSTIASNPVLFSPGRDNTDNTPFSSTIKWTGTTDTNWNTTTNWLGGAVPSSSADVVIPAGLTNFPTISSATTVNSALIESGATLIANAAFTGNVTYKRNLPTTNWYLVSSPVSGETIQDLRTNHTFATGSGGGRIGIASYKNDGTAWNYYTNSSTGSITSGEGLSTKLSAVGDISFTGTINTGPVSYGITQATNNLNLVGNPYTSYINLGTFFTNNAAALSEQTIWMWNQATSSYDLKMSGTHASFQIAPGQAFFVSADSNTNVTFSTANQSHQTTDTFQRNSRTEISISASEGKASISTNIYYINGASKGFDNGYDGTVFGGISSKFTLYSQLVSNNDGRNLAIQSLPLNNIEKTVVPLGLKADSGKEIEFSASAKNLPNTVKVFLEDRSNGEFINLSENNYKTTLDKDHNGIGRFYIHTTSLKTDLGINSIENVSIYKSNTNTITITGLQANNASLSVYSILGEKVVQKTFSSNGISSISTPSLASGVYIFEIKSEIGTVNKKIILE